MGGDDHSAVPAGARKFASREAMYAETVKEVASIVPATGARLITALSNAASQIFYNMNAAADPEAPLHTLPVNWCGFYLVTSPTLLELGPFQGKLACEKIKIGKGVCGTAVLTKKDQAVPDVHAVPGHIACDSGSNSEAVVLIRCKSGAVVALLDIDSTVSGFFSESDLPPLAEMCAHIGAALDGQWPMQVAAGPSSNPSAMVRPPPAAAPGTKAPWATTTVQAEDGATYTAAQLPTKIPAFQVTSTTAARPAPKSSFVHHGTPATPQKPEIEVHQHGGWEFQATTMERMMKSTELDTWGDQLGVKLLPEVVFESNTLALVYPMQRDAKRIGLARCNISARDILTECANYYKTDEFRAHADDVHMPASQWWIDKRKETQTLDAGICWSFRNRFVGKWEFVPAGSIEAQPLALDAAPEGTGIDYAMLKDQSLPIRFYTAFDVYEDDLHDGGMSKLIVKARVMDPCYFVLLRLVVRVDGVVLVTRDVRIFHKFGRGEPIVVEEVERILRVEDYMASHPGTDLDGLRRQMTNADECTPHMSTTFTRTRVVALPDGESAGAT